MTKTSRLTLLAALTTLTLGACSKSDDSSDKGDSPKTSAAKPSESKQARKEAVTVASMGLALDVPSGSEVTDNTANAGFPSGTLYADPTIFLIGANDMFWKADIAAQKAEIEKDPGNTFKKFTKEEATEGGFHLEYELASMLDPKETLYGFHIRATVDGKKVDCSSNTSSPAEMARGVAMCKSLRASK